MSHSPFHPSELDGVADPAGSAEILAMARELERLDGGAIRPSDGFTDRVLAAVAGEPLPRPMAAAGLAAREGRFGAMLAALRDTWHVAWSGGRPLAARAQAMAFVLVLIVAVGSVSGLATVGAMNALFPATATPSLVPSPQTPVTPSPSRRPDEVLPPAGPTAPPKPVQTAEPTDTPEPTETPEPNETPKPTQTDKHTERPGHTETPEPTETPDANEDSGGSGGDSHGGVETEHP